VTQSTQTQLEQTMPSLATIADGAVSEAFEIELQKVLINIADPNTDPNAKREINIKVVLAPIGEEREEVRVGIQCSTKTVSHKPIDTLFWMRPVGGIVGCTEIKRRQTTLADYNG
jgi:phosphate-selective porin